MKSPKHMTYQEIEEELAAWSDTLPTGPKSRGRGAGRAKMGRQPTNPALYAASKRKDALLMQRNRIIQRGTVSSANVRDHRCSPGASATNAER